ncbi:hypothetical protein QR46_0695 [Giardia duodenalis assemblage B]|uniref:Uncharacterized protein n=1 Tax=Giardia duodenalis assemblage B TaxID=1394984 RepID=A0A132NYV3_GIAIN|nr:hypothetical protein QR46_0695 [Giardia intestinalis assemblage B]
MLANFTRVKQVTPVSEHDSAISNVEWLTSLLMQVKAEALEERHESIRPRSSQFDLSDSLRMRIVESLLSSTRLQEVCTSPLSIASLLRHTSLISMLGQDIGNGLDLSVGALVDTLPALAELSLLLQACDDEVYNTFMHPVHGYVVLLRQRHAVQRKLESLSSYAQDCCFIANAIPQLLSSRLTTALNHIEQKYFQSYSL